MMPASSSAKSRILALARRSGVTYRPTYEDALAEVITRLSDDDVVTDDIEDLTVALKRSGIISGNEMVDLLGQYLTEKYNV